MINTQWRARPIQKPYRHKNFIGVMQFSNAINDMVSSDIKHSPGHLLSNAAVFISSLGSGERPTLTTNRKPPC